MKRLDALQGNLGYWLVQVSKAHRDRAEILLREHGLYIAQEIVLLHLAEADGMSQATLTERLGVEQPTVARMIQRMERANLVERVPDPDDKRISKLYLTEQARGLLENIQAIWRQLDEELMQNLTDAEQVLLRRLLEQMLHNFRVD